MTYSAEQASELAVRVLIALAERPEDLTRFMEMAGLQPQELRNLARRRCSCWITWSRTTSGCATLPAP